MSGSISSSTYYNVTNSTSSSGNTPLAGLMSGMETDKMVEKMLSGTQGKIDKQQGLKQQATWKQEMYRDVITSINGFYDKYFNTSYGSTLKNNFAKDSFFNAMTSAVKSGNAVNIVSTSDSALIEDMNVVVKQLASHASLVSQQKMSTNQTIAGAKLGDTEQLTKLFDKSVTLSIGEEKITVDLSSVTTQEDMVKAINDTLSAKGVTAKIFNDRLRFVTDENTTVSVDSTSSELGLKMTGLTAGASSKKTEVGSNMLQGTQVQPDTGYTFDITLDGVQKSITLNNVKSTLTFDDNHNIKSTTVTAEAVQTALAEKVRLAFGDYVKVELVNDSLNFSLGKNLENKDGEKEKGHELVITGADAKKIGVTPGTSTLFSTATKLNAVAGISGDKFSFNINGVDFSFEGNTSIGSMINTINSSNAGVRISYSSLSDVFKMESTSTGSQYGIQIDQKSGNILSALFGDSAVTAGTSVSSKYLTTGSIQGKKDALKDYTTKSVSLKMKVNGASYTYTLPEKNDKSVYTAKDIEDNFNIWLKDKFGKGNISYDAETGSLQITDGSLVQFEATKIDTENKDAYNAALKSDLALVLGFNQTATSNIATGSTAIADIKQKADLAFLLGLENLDGLQGDLQSISQFVHNGKTYNLSFSEGRLILSKQSSENTNSAADEITFNTNNYLFGSTVTIGTGKITDNTVNPGTDAEIEVNGTTTTRSSNSFTINGVTMEATKVSAKDSSDKYESTVIATSRDINAVTDGFKSFVDDYNAMLEKLNGYLGEEANYRKYPPLTTEQKKDMTDKEIELWEEKSKQGLLRHDDTISSFLVQMRSVLYTKPAGSTLALYNIGIDTTKSYNDKGKLQFDEAAFKQAFSSNPGAVRTLFTAASDGLSAQLMSAMKGAAERSSGSPGSLVRMAGIEGGSSGKNNTISKQIKSIETKIKDLKTKYDKERTRYWSQFTKMEKAMSSYNKQMSSLSSFTGG